MMVLAIVVEAGGICYASRNKRVAEEEVSIPSPTGIRPRVVLDDDVREFESTPSSWKSFMRRVPVSEEPGPTRRVSGAAVAVGRRESC